MGLTIGDCYELKVPVEPRYSAAAIGSGGLELLATPYLIAMMEGAAFKCAEPHLPEGRTTVGTSVAIRHLAATPIGAEVTARAELIEIDGRRLVFRVEARDGLERIGEGTHERFVVDSSKFLMKLAEKDGRIRRSLSE